MPVLGVTGGIATGKSTFVRKLQSVLSAQFFDADQCARELLESDVEVGVEVRDQFGTEILHCGRLNRAKLRALVFSDATKRKSLEAILHPRIRARWLALAEKVRASGGDEWLVVEIPLLYETAAEGEFDRVLVVGCDADTQRRRLETERGLDQKTITGILEAQWPLERKLAVAHHVIWSEGLLDVLTRQTALFADYLKSIHG